MKQSPQQPDGGKKSSVRRLMIFFALAYVANGLGQESGLISQPLTYYLKTAFGWGPDVVTTYLTIVILPWIIKPLYGLISDFVPLFGYRRRTWLFAANILAAAGYVWMSHVVQPSQIIVGLLMASFGIAISATLCGAILVEKGKKYGVSGTLVNQQWIWFMIASVGAALVGGWLTSHLTPADSFHTAAWIVACAPLGVLLGCWFLVEEEKAQMNIAGLKTSVSALKDAFKSRKLWIAGLFIFFYNFSPSFGAPLYFYQTDVLKFDQQFIGLLSAIGAGASVVGGFIYAWLQKRVTMKQLMYMSITMGVVSQFSYLLLMGHTSAIILAVMNGIFGMISLVAALALAADFCPDGAEGFSYALLLSINNLAIQLSANLGSQMYVHVFNNQLNPLIIASGLFTCVVFFLVPLLKLGNQMPSGNKTDEEQKPDDTTVPPGDK